MEKIYKIDGMSCNHCVKAVEVELKKISLNSFEVEIGFAKINFDENKVTESEIHATIEKAGFTIVS